MTDTAFPRPGTAARAAPTLARRHPLPGDPVTATLRLAFKVGFPLALLADVFHVEWAAQAVTMLITVLLFCALLLPVALVVLAALASATTRLLG